jgi:hypothetical protein
MTPKRHVLRPRRWHRFPPDRGGYALLLQVPKVRWAKRHQTWVRQPASRPSRAPADGRLSGARVSRCQAPRPSRLSKTHPLARPRDRAFRSISRTRPRRRTIAFVVRPCSSGRVLWRPCDRGDPVRPPPRPTTGSSVHRSGASTWSSTSAKQARRAEAARRRDDDSDRHGAASSSGAVRTGISGPSTPVWRPSS